MSEMTPREIVQELDKHIIGQDAAKRAVAIALRNRWRRQQLDEGLREGRPYRAVITVDLYGQCADYDRIAPACATYDVPMIEHAAEALRATYRHQPADNARAGL